MEKPLCYTLLPLVFDSLRSSDSHKSIVLVVSPLTALMIDQKHKYASLGMAVEFVGEAQDDPAPGCSTADIRWFTSVPKH